MSRSVRIRNGTLIAVALVAVPAGMVYFIETTGRPPPPVVVAPASSAGHEAPLSNDELPPNVIPGIPSDPTQAEPVRPPRTAPVVVRSPDPGRSPLADRLNAPAGDIRTDLAILARVFDNFRTELGGNPTGNNREITAQLSGRNPRRHAPLPQDHPSINESGELIDRWGTPFFFHALSALKMEIRSAGPDREMYTDDDAVWSPQPTAGR